MRLTNNFFSHIYIERRAADYELTSDILKRFPNAQQIFIGHYKDIFNRPGQSFPVQKMSRKMILAVKEAPFLYKGSEFCFIEPGKNFYYTTPALNCVYDCDYCFLQGMYVSANIVIFVNTEDFLNVASENARNHPLHLNVSYETDLPAIENIAPLVGVWADWAALNKTASIEIRTKSANTGYFDRLLPNPQTTLAWTLSPQIIIDRYEHRTPPLTKRMRAIHKAIEKGWKVRLCWDPLIYHPGWEDAYKESVKTVFRSVHSDQITDAQIGVFRINSEYLKNIQRQREDTDVLYQVFERIGNSVSYPSEIRKKMVDCMTQAISKFLPANKIHIIGCCHPG